MLRPFSSSVLPVDADDPDLLLKLVLIGDSGVGKSNLLGQFVRHQFNAESKTTIGVEFATKMLEVGGKSVKAQIWDTAGQERYRAITASYYKGAVGALLLYDVTASPTFRSVPKWLRELQEHAEAGAVVMLVGNKVDCEDERSVAAEEGAHYALKQRLLFAEASARDATNVAEAFDRLIREIVAVHSEARLLAVEPRGHRERHGAGVALVRPEQRRCC
jgi:small GTP-binding protein